MRILIVVPPLVGHSSPPLAIAEELESRGHEVAWAGVSEFHSRYVPRSATFYGCRTGWGEAGMPERPPKLMGPGALKFFWEEHVVPFADGSAADVEAAVLDFRPNLMLVDQQALAGSMVAERLGIPWVTSATTMIELINPVSRLPKVHEWRDELFAGLRRRIGDPLASHNPLFSPTLTIAFGIAGLFGARADVGSPVEFVGPVFRPVAASAEMRTETERILDWTRASAKPTVLIALGTTNIGAGDRFIRAAAEGVQNIEYQAIVADPSNALGKIETPELLTMAYVPQQQLLADVDAFINHGGYNSVCESLWHNVPMVLAGIRDDQPLIAEKAHEYGVGIAVRFSRATSSQIAKATRSVIEDPSYRENTKPYGDALRGAGGVGAAVDAIERVSANNPVLA